MTDLHAETARPSTVRTGATLAAVLLLVGALAVPGLASAPVDGADIGYSTTKYMGWDTHEGELWGAALGGIAGGAIAGATSAGIGVGAGVGVGIATGAA